MRLAVARATAASAVCALLACGGSNVRDASHRPGRTEVVFVPTLHAAHPREDGYSLAYLCRLLTAIAPDVVLAEIPPAAFARVVAASDARVADGVAGSEASPWLRERPELAAVVLRLRQELHYEVVPVSGLTPAALHDYRAYFAAHPSGPDAGYYRRALRAVRVMADEDDAREDPGYALSPSYRRLVGWPRQALSTAAERELGEAGPRRVAHAHYALMRQAIAVHQGQRIAVVFDAADGWYLVPRLRRLPGVHYIDALAFEEALERSGRCCGLLARAPDDGRHAD